MQKIFAARCSRVDFWCMIKDMISSNEGLINELRLLGYLKTDRIAEAFATADRKLFVPQEIRSHAYLNEPLAIGYGQTISQPLVTAFMLDLLEIKPGETILEIGTGSGWQTALCALLAYDAAHERQTPAVVSIERVHELYDRARTVLGAWNEEMNKIILCIEGDGTRGDSEHMPYDKIISGAAAAEDVPQAWKDQLTIGGRIVAPIKNSIVVLDKTGKNDFLKREFFGYSFVPLVAGK